MKIKENCEWCKAKDSLLKIFTPIRFTKGKRRTRSDKTTFYICKKCGHHQNFNINQIIGLGTFWAYFVEGDDIESVKSLHGQKSARCIICNYAKKPPHPAENEITEPAVIKLYVKPDKRFLGYVCLICRIAYYLPIRIMKWENSQFFKKKEKVDLLNPLTSQLPESIREKHPKYNKELKLIQDIRYLDRIGSFTASPGAPFGGQLDNTVTIQIPKSKYKKVMNYLRKNKVTILR